MLSKRKTDIELAFDPSAGWDSRPNALAEYVALDSASRRDDNKLMV
jgi:hypothetical protein